MQQLIQVTSEPFQCIRLTQNARFVPSDSMDLERRKALARHFVFQQRYHSAGQNPQSDINYVNQVNITFSQNSNSVPVSGSKDMSLPFKQTAVTKQTSKAAHHLPQQTVSESRKMTTELTESATAAPSNSMQAQSSYLSERGSFELRVLKGDLTFVPPLVMTVITQYPDIHFEYTGGFNFVPPSAELSQETFNLSI
ncbi:hypothetical protein [Hungatella hathewayi]|uniref:hypothetical protein n=1 Tax=Hungatella hathewayi TaxID=154046 RepID=UPI003563DC3F